jgi:signal transduction histidine kinase
MLRFDDGDSVSVEEIEPDDTSLADVGSDRTLLAPLVRAAAARVAARCTSEDAKPAEVESSVGTLTELLLQGAGSFDPDSHSPEGLATLRWLLDQLCVETLQGGAAASLEAGAFVGAVETFARVRRILTSREDADFASLLAPDGSDLVVELSHDLRSPLTSILFLSETLRRGQSGDINEYQRRQLGIIYSAALGLISMASDVIELARGGEQLLERKPTPFSVGEILDSVCDMVQPLAEENSNTIRILPPNVDQRQGYPVALSRVLLNLTTNALKFTERGFVEVMAKEIGRTTIEFSVRDAGRGMDDEDVAQLFQPFHRVRSSNRYGFSGSGLGLSICRNLVRAMGSDLSYETTRGWGTRFFFEVELPPVSAL